MNSKALGIICLMALFCSCSFSKKSSKKLYTKAVEQAPYDAIIVPGYVFENQTWNWIMRGRIYWAKHLLDQGIAKNIIFSGGAVYTPYYEAEIMALYGTAIGIPQHNIFRENKAEHSTENIYYSFKFARQLGFNKVALATDPFQSRMLKRFIKKRVSRDLALIPMVIDTMKVIEPEMINPQIDIEKAFNPNFISIKKRENWWKRFRGTLGRNIDKDLYKAN